MHPLMAEEIARQHIADLVRTAEQRRQARPRPSRVLGHVLHGALRLIGGRG
jgi:hypothetical protein